MNTCYAMYQKYRKAHHQTTKAMQEPAAYFARAVHCKLEAAIDSRYSSRTATLLISYQSRCYEVLSRIPLCLQPHLPLPYGTAPGVQYGTPSSTYSE